MNNKSLKKNYIYNAIYQVVLIITPLIVAPYISRVLGADGIGKVSFSESIVSYFVLFSTLGINIYGQREISYSQNDINKRSIIFYRLFFLKLFTTFIVTLIYLYLIFNIFNSYIYVAFITSIIASAFDITWFFQGLEEFGKIVLRNVLAKVLSVILIFTLVKSKNDILYYVFSITIFTLLGNISLFTYLPQYIKKVDFKSIHIFNDFHEILSLFIPTIAIQVYTVLDKSMIGIITSSDFENGYYEQASKMSKVVLMIITALGTAAAPRIGSYYGNNEIGKLKSLIYNSYRFVLFLGIPMCLGFILISDCFVPLFFGHGFEKVSILMKILSFLIIAIGISNVTGVQYLLPTKKQNIFTLSVVIGAIVNFLLNLILIKQFLSIGAAIASIIAEFAVSFTQLYAVRDKIDCKKILYDGKNYFIAGAFMFIAVFIIRSFFSYSVKSFFIIVLSGILIYFAVLVVMRDEFLIKNFKTIFNKLLVKLS